MIDITNKSECCGCEACVQACPTSCISFEVDTEGFNYPKVDTSACVKCGVCRDVCPMIHSSEPLKPIAIYGAKNRNEEIRQESSSGGVFTLLAEQIIDQGGVVFGAKFNSEWCVEHSYATTREELRPLRGSKYVQSKIGRSYIDAKRFLKEGRKVLFSGTPCQIAGLRYFLRREYENLLSIDIICHGVPSPRVWRLYKEELLNSNNASQFTFINFRDKGAGWRNYSLRAKLQTPQSQLEISIPLRRSAYMRGFLKGTFSRPSCHKCPSKSSRSGADITIADFWGIERVLPELDDNKGTSMAIINTQKGAEIFSTLSLESQKVRRSAIQHTYYKSERPNKKRAQFFEALDSMGTLSITPIINAHTKPTLIKKFTRSLNKFLSRFIKI